ncbi:MAG: FAD-binding oxidoreductase [Chloroflexi bacterium]|nr:MAG: FAD-binding oxidoreductase [Chloroflexota bacterium]
MGAGRPVEVAIVGGGIIGCAAAAFAAEAGARVTLYERAEIGAGASGRNMGAVQHPFDPILAPLYEETVQIYRELSQRDDEFSFPGEPAGLLMVTPDPTLLEPDGEEPPLGPRSDLLAPRQVQSLEPSLADDLWATRLETGFPIPPHAATAAMARRAREGGAQLELGAAAVPAVVNGRAVGVVLEGLRPRAADLVLIAAGPWSPYLLDPSGRWQPIVATWGATAQLELASPPRHVVEELRVESVNQPVSDAATARPPSAEKTPSIFTLAAAGSVVTIGSTFLAFEPDPRAMAPLLVERGKRFLPGLRDTRIVATRACARPQSLDGRPLVGEVAGMQGLFLAAGHGPWGISSGPASARLVVDAMLGGDASVIPDGLNVRRFDTPTVREVHV